MAKRPGAHTTNRLTVLGVSRQKTPGKYADGGGLYLQIAKTGSRVWVFRYMIEGKARVMGLGPVSDIPLDQARQLAFDARELMRAGHDPLDHRAAQRQLARDSDAPASPTVGKTFKWCADTYVDTVKLPELSNPKHASQWGSTLHAYVYPKIGDRDISTISIEDVRSVLEPIWLSKTETATRVRQRVEAVMDWARVMGYCSGENPARWKGHLEHLLAKPSKVKDESHHPSLPYSRVSAFMAALSHRDGASKSALEFLILTAQRTNPVILAEWSEIDWEEKIWTAPATKMKGDFPHRVPLSKQALETLESRKPFTKGPFIFNNDGEPLSNAAMLMMVSKMHSDRTPWVDPRQGDRRIVPHGFRSTFRDWAAEVAEAEHALCELALAHVESSKTVAAYLRTDMLERRRPLMAKWASFVCGGVRPS